MNMPSAKPQTFKMTDRIYTGANPEYRNVSPMGQPAHYVKVAKGVPFKRH